MQDMSATLRYLATHNAVIDDKIIFEFQLHPHFALSSHYEFIWKREKLLGEFNVLLNVQSFCLFEHAIEAAETIERRH